MRYCRLICFLAALLISYPAAQAQIVTYSTFGPGDAFEFGSAYAVGTYHDEALAAGFVPTMSGTLSNITVAAYGDLDSDQILNVQLFSGSTGDGLIEPGLTLGTLTVPSASAGEGLLDVALSGPPVNLVADQFYYLALTPASGTENYAGWNWASPEGPGSLYVSLNGGSTWGPGGGEQVAFSVSEVPEPSSWMLSLGALGVILFKLGRGGRMYSERRRAGS